MKKKTKKCYQCKGSGQKVYLTGILSVDVQKCSVCNGKGRIMEG